MTARDDAIKAVLGRDGGTCHGFGRLHCFGDPAAKWEGRRCSACHDWASAMVDAVEPIIRADGECVEVECPHLLEAAALAAQVSNLTRWKIEATTVIKAWEQVHGLLGSPGQIGESKASATYDRVVALLGGEPE